MTLLPFCKLRNFIPDPRVSPSRRRRNPRRRAPILTPLFVTSPMDGWPPPDVHDGRGALSPGHGDLSPGRASSMAAAPLALAMPASPSLHYRKTGLCRLLKYFATCQRHGSRQTFSLPTPSKSSRQRILCRLPNYPGRWQRKAVGKDVLCRLPGRWQRNAGGKGGCLAGGKGKLVAKVAGH